MLHFGRREVHSKGRTLGSMDAQRIGLKVHSSLKVAQVDRVVKMSRLPAFMDRALAIKIGKPW